MGYLHKWVVKKEFDHMGPLVDDYDKSRWSTWFPLQILYFLPLILYLISCCCCCCCCCCFRGQLDVEADQDLVDEEGLKKDLQELTKHAKRFDSSLPQILGFGSGRSHEIKPSESKTPSPRQGRAIRRRRVKRVAVIKRNVS